MYYRPFNLSKTMYLFLLGQIALLGEVRAQDRDCQYPQLECNPIDAQRPNVIRCVVIWAPAEDSTACFKSKPDSWEDELLETQNFTEPNQEIEGVPEELIGITPPPEWKYYWEVSNGNYYKDSTDQLTINFRETGEYQISLSVTPIYSPNPRPPRRQQVIQVLELDNSTLNTIPHSNFDEEDDENKEVKVEADWSSVVSGDTVTMAITYRNTNLRNANGKSGALLFKLPNDDIMFLTARGAFVDQSTGKINGEKTMIWDIGNVPPGVERTIFADFLIETDHTADDFQDEIKLSAGIVWENQRSLSLRCLLGLNWN